MNDIASLNIDKSDLSIFCQQGPSHLLAIKEGVLTGRTFVFKDLFDVQGYVTGAGNPAWLASHGPAEHTSPLISALLNAGAESHGRVQTDELAYSLNGQNIHYGTPLNPLAPDCLPGGSSSGSAVVVARQQADFSIGTDTGGSVRVPASYCGLYGLRPTLGKLDLSHSFTLAESFDTAGIFTRNLSLLSQVFDVLDTDTVWDNPTVQSEAYGTLYLEKSLLQFFSEQRFARLKHWAESSGMTLLPSDFLGRNDYSLESLSLLFRTIQGYEIIAGHQAWLEEHGKTLDPAILARVEWSQAISESEYLQAKQAQAQFQHQLQDFLHHHSGVMLLPTTPSGPPKLSLSGQALADYRSQLMGLTSLAGLSGFPQLHLPMQGLPEGPCGVSLLGLADTERGLMACAARLQKGQEI